MLALAASSHTKQILCVVLCFHDLFWLFLASRRLPTYSPTYQDDWLIDPAFWCQVCDLLTFGVSLVLFGYA